MDKFSAIEINKKNYGTSIVELNYDFNTGSDNYIIEDSKVIDANFEVGQIYLQQALAYFKANQWNEAITACQEALNISSNLAAAYKIWGNALQKMDRSIEAIGIYAKAIALQPDMPEIYSSLGSLFAKQQKWHQAIDYYHKSLQLGFQNAGVYRCLTQIWEELEEENKALACFIQVLNLEPETLTPKQHYQLGIELNDEGKIAEAITCLCHAIDLDAKFEAAYNPLIKLLQRYGREGEAKTYQDRLQSLLNSTLEIEQPLRKNKRFMNLLDSARLPSSRHTTKTASQSNQQLPNGIDNSSRIKGLGNDRINNNSQDFVPEIAKSSPNQQLKLDSPAVQVNLGSLYARKQQWQQAFVHYQTAIKLDPNYAVAYRNLAKVLLKIGKLSHALEILYRGYRVEPQTVSGADHFRLGEQLQQKGKLKEASDCYRWAIQYQPQLIQAYLSLGTILANQGDLKGAMACYANAIKQNADCTEAYLLLKQVQARLPVSEEVREVKLELIDNPPQKTRSLPQVLTGEELIKKSNSDQKHGEQVTNLSVNFQQQTVEQSRSAIIFESPASEIESNLKSNVEQIANLQDTLQLDSQNSWNHHNLGKALLNQAQPKQAIGYFEEATKLDPDIPWNYFYWAEGLVQLGQLESAIELYQKTIQLEPSFIWSHHNLGEVLVKLNQWEKAVTAYKQACTLHPEAAIIHEKLADAYYNLGDSYYDEAFRHYYRAIELDCSNLSLYHRGIEVNPEEPQLYFQLARYLSTVQEWHQVAAFCQIVLLLQPDHAPAHALLGECALEYQRYHQAITYFKTAINYSPQEANYYARLAKALVEHGNWEEAIIHYQQAIALEPESAFAYHSLGDLYIQQEDWEQAMSFYRRASQLEPENGVIHKKMGDIFAKHNNQVAASQAYLQAMKFGFSKD